MKPQNHNNKNRKPRTEKEKIVITTYEKKFEDFFVMIDEMRALHPEIDENIFAGQEVGSVTEALKLVTGYFNECVPDLSDKKNLNCSLTVSANKVVLKTNKFFTIAWKYKYDRESNISDIVANITLFTREGYKLYEDIANMVNILEESWTVVEK